MLILNIDRIFRRDRYYFDMSVPRSMTSMWKWYIELKRASKNPSINGIRVWVEIDP